MTRPLSLVLAAAAWTAALSPLPAAAAEPSGSAPACRPLDDESEEARSLAGLAMEVARSIAEVDAGRLQSLGSERFRRLMDLPSLRDYAQRAAAQGLALASVDRVRALGARPAPVPGRAGWSAATCGADPLDPDHLVYEAKGAEWQALVLAEGPLLAEPRERGRIALAVGREGGAWRVTDLSITRATLLGRDAQWYVDRARRLGEQAADPWAVREAADRAAELAFVGHRMRTGAGNRASALKGALPPESRPDGTWVEPGDGAAPPLPVLRVARHAAAVRPELRVEYLATDPEDHQRVGAEADRLMAWLREVHPAYLALFHRVRFAPLPSQQVDARVAAQGAEVRTVRPVDFASLPAE